MKNLKIVPLQPHTSAPVFREKSSFMRALHVISPVLIYYVIVTLGNVFFATWFSITAQGNQNGALVSFFVSHSNQVAAVVNVIAMGISGACMIPLFLKEKPVFHMPVGKKGRLFLVALVSLMSAIAFNYLFGSLQALIESDSYEQVAQTQFSLPLWAGIIIYGILSPLVEEIVFRGLVYNRLRRQYSVTIAIVFSGLIFGAYHGNLIQMGYGFVLGIMMAVLYERFGSFWVPVLFHSVANAGIYFIMHVSQIKEIVMTGLSCVICLILSGIIMIVLLEKRGNEDD